MHTYDLINIFIMPFTIIYVTMFIMVYGQKYVRIYTRNKILRFTQEEVKEKRKEIDEVYTEIQMQKNSHKVFDDTFLIEEKIVKIFKLYNEMAVGINEGLYDEDYVKMVIGYDMMDFYKEYYRVIVYSSEQSSRFLSLELLLKKWDDEGMAPYRINKHRRIL